MSFKAMKVLSSYMTPLDLDAVPQHRDLTAFWANTRRLLNSVLGQTSLDELRDCHIQTLLPYMLGE